MIQIYFADERDIIIEHKDFRDSQPHAILSYIKEGLIKNNVKIIKLRKWESK